MRVLNGWKWEERWQALKDWLGRRRGVVWGDRRPKDGGTSGGYMKAAPTKD